MNRVKIKRIVLLESLSRRWPAGKKIRIGKLRLLESLKRADGRSR